MGIKEGEIIPKLYPDQFMYFALNICFSLQLGQLCQRFIYLHSTYLEQRSLDAGLTLVRVTVVTHFIMYVQQVILQVKPLNLRSNPKDCKQLTLKLVICEFQELSQFEMVSPSHVYLYTVIVDMGCKASTTQWWMLNHVECRNLSHTSIYYICYITLHYTTYIYIHRVKRI